MADLGDRFRLVANEIEVVAPDEPLPNLPVARAVWKPAPSLSTSAELWLTAGGPHHTVLTGDVDPETLRDFAEMVHTELLMIDADTTPAGSPTASAGTRPTTGWPTACPSADHHTSMERT